MKAKNNQTAVSASNSTALLAFLLDAKVDVDHCVAKGQVCRGAYISRKDDGRIYLQNDLTIREGANDPKCWWDNIYDAQDFVSSAIKDIHDTNV